MCVPRRAKFAPRIQLRRKGTRARPINTERKALLLGTALVSTFLLGSMLAPSPVAAQTTVISQEQIRNNNAKRTTGLEAELTFNVTRYNNLEADQSFTLTNDIVVNNSGDIDPVIAISAYIYNYSVDFRNYSPPGYSDVSQGNAVINTIIVVNSGGLIADDAGIVATVRNNDSVLLNDGFASNFDGDDFGILDQNTGITQTNTLTNAIILNTDGDIVAGQDGIDASVHNSLLQIQNATESFNDSFGDGDILTQIAEVEQANVLANLIEVGNGGAIVTNDSGIRAGIQLANQKELHYERLYVPRLSYTTGDIDAHELGIDKNDQLIFVNTKYSCLATPDTVHSFKPLWKPPFISKIAPEDRYHLNGLAMKDGAPKYVTAVSHSDVVDGWRERRHEGGILIDVENDRIHGGSLHAAFAAPQRRNPVGARFGPRLSLPH